MKYKQFKELIESYKKSQKAFSELYDLGFDFYEGKYELARFTDEILDTALKTHYTVEGIDWINWFIFETDYGNIDMKGIDNDGSPICYDMKSTYEYCEQYRFTSDTYI